ncbi:MAG TPA: sigma 54-interacting transcriptional regulator, partial [Vicinamibacterales bacterium]
MVDARNGVQALAIGRRVAEEGRRHGFVAMAVDIYFRLRGLLMEDLAERALLLIGRFMTAEAAGRAALLDASARAARPHVLVTFQCTAGTAHACVAREARVAYGAVGARSPRETAPGLARYVDYIDKAEAFLREGRHAAGERLLRETAGALGRRRAFGESAKALTILGRLLLERGRATDADHVLDDAARDAAAAHDEGAGLSARLWQAAARCDCERFTDAESLCRATLVAGSLPSASRRWAEALLVRVLLWQGRSSDEAVPSLLTDEERAEAGASTAAFVDGVAVHALLVAGKVFAAGQRAGFAVEHAAAAADPMARAIAHTASLRVRAAAGDLVTGRESFDHVRLAARQAHTPLRLVRARIVWHDALRQAGRLREADAHLTALARIRSAAPPLLGRAIERRLAGRDPIRSVVSIVRPPASAQAASSLIRIAHEHDEDATAVRRVLEWVTREIQASRVELQSCDAGPVTTLLAAGSGLATHLGSRVLDTGIVIGPETHAGGHELGVPVRLGTRLLACVVARWPVDRSPASHASDMLDLAAAVVAPRIEAHLAGARVDAAASTSVPELVGVSRAMEDVRRAIVRAAGAPFNVLVAGESGSGKEVAARAIHQLSARRERRFCDVNCAAIPEDLLDSELFGHARGAF